MNRGIRGLFVVIISIAILSFGIKEKEKFTGEKLLQDCQIEIPLFYSTKGQEALKKAADKYKDIEIVLVTVKKKGKVTYTYYYLVGYENEYGSSAYLTPAKEYKSDSPRKTAIYMKYKASSHLFYTAVCFREKLATHSSLKENLMEII